MDAIRKHASIRSGKAEIKWGALIGKVGDAAKAEAVLLPFRGVVYPTH